MSRRASPLRLAPECRLGQRALNYRVQNHFGIPPVAMFLTGDGCVKFLWVEVLPRHTQSEHYRCPETGQCYDEGWSWVSIEHLMSTPMPDETLKLGEHPIPSRR